MDAYKNTAVQPALKGKTKNQIGKRSVYDKRIKIFIILIVLLLLVCLIRLIQMQLMTDSSLQDKIAELKLQRSRTQLLKTVRGEIQDRKDRVLAANELKFQLCIDYKLTSFADQRVRKAILLRAAAKEDAKAATEKAEEQIRTKLDDLQQIIDKCVRFGLERAQIESTIKKINDSIWNLRTYLAWKRNYPDQDFTTAVADPNDRLLMTDNVDIPEMYKSFPLLDLKTDDDIFTAQLEFMDVDGVGILPTAQRLYPYNCTASQTIGWVGPATQKEDKQLFEDDELAQYMDDEVCGREDGVEYVCESTLRGRRGKEVYNIDSELVNRTETRFGKDIHLTLDIELQQRIEQYLADCNYNDNCKQPTAAVVMDIATGHILALVSMPVFDLNRIRYDYPRITADPNEPLRNRAINKQYPPGSVVKPLILIAGLETGKITPLEIISCPPHEAPPNWPNCWLYNRFPGNCHDDRWSNFARNAIKGSCNIYFSRLADRIDANVLQQWLFRFGYARQILPPPAAVVETGINRNFRQVAGIISTNVPAKNDVFTPEKFTLQNREKKLFGIGQGNLRATPLQVANAMAAIARGGMYKPPRLFLDDDTQDQIPLNISPQTLDIVRDGMGAVVSEYGGTAYEQFAHAGFAAQGIKVFGKTGSTENPDNAWFAGFAEHTKGHGIAIALVVEGGQHGSQDAAPLARDIIQFCIETGYIGKDNLTTQ